MTEYLKKSELAGEVEKELASVINKHSLENASNTPDFILAKFLATCLCAYNTACQDNGKWHTEDKPEINFDTDLDPKPYERRTRMENWGKKHDD